MRESTSFRVVGGRLDLLPGSIVCQVHDGSTRVLCIVARQLLRELRELHRLGGADEAVFSELLPEIERMATRKINSCAIGDRVRLDVGDLLRFGRVARERAFAARPAEEAGRAPSS